TLWRHLNLCASAPGARRLRGWLERPLPDLAALASRHDQVGACLEAGGARSALRESLAGLADLERLAARIACARATPRDLGALRDVLRRLPAISDVLGGLASRGDGAAAPPALSVDPALLARLEAALVDEPPPVSREG